MSGIQDQIWSINTPFCILLIVTFFAILETLRRRKTDWTQVFKNIDGKVQFSVPLSGFTRFRTGGLAEVLFTPSSIEELQCVLRKISTKVPVTVLGFGSNVLIRDGGINGIVIKLSHSAFRRFSFDTSTFQVRAGAGLSQLKFAKLCAQKGISGLEFFCGIPGSMGGALRMNAGAHGKEVSNCLLFAEVMDRTGEIHNFTPKDLHHTYRSCGGVPHDWIFISGTFIGEPGIPSVINRRIEEMITYRENCQPVNERTAGCTFTNPSNAPAWKLITQVGLQGMTIGEAQVSIKHANFLINLGHANSKQLEDLGNFVVEKVKAVTATELNWEIIRLGKP